ncbi:MAG: hypothetical protein AAGA83_10970 [Cyanobacteria bacterium P01_F01_bin.116]
MSITVLPQLIEAEANLSEQEAALVQQLADIQEQRKGLQTVIAMFDASSGEPMVAPSEIPPVKDEEPEAEEETVADKLAKVTKKAKISDRKAKLANVRKTKSAKAASPKKVDGRTARWQRYVRDAHRDERLQDVVENVLKANPKDSFKIADVMSAIFEDNMPKAQYLKARSRISNILSAGARDNEWYRGRGGTYSMSAKALK